MKQNCNGEIQEYRSAERHEIAAEGLRSINLRKSEASTMNSQFDSRYQEGEPLSREEKFDWFTNQRLMRKYIPMCGYTAFWTVPFEHIDSAALRLEEIKESSSGIAENNGFWNWRTRRTLVAQRMVAYCELRSMAKCEIMGELPPPDLAYVYEDEPANSISRYDYIECSSFVDGWKNFETKLEN